MTLVFEKKKKKFNTSSVNDLILGKFYSVSGGLIRRRDTCSCQTNLSSANKTSEVL